MDTIDPSPLIHESRYQLGTKPMPVAPYVSREQFELERERIFKKAWLPVARVEDIPKVGDYLAMDIKILETSIILVRQSDTKIAAFHNICPHRCNKIVKAGCGHARRLRCEFHGWTFNLTGELYSATNLELFDDLDKSKMRLPELSVGTWEGFIFINRDPAPTETLKQSLGELHDGYSGYFDDKKMVWAWGVEQLESNWKILLDASSEAYHAPVLHLNTLRNSLTGKKNPQCLFNRIDLYEYHRTASVYANPDYRPLPTEKIVSQYAATKIYPFSAAVGGLPPGINPDRNENWIFDLVGLFPNVFLMISTSWYSITWLWPVSENQTDIYRRVYMYQPKTPSDVIAQENMMVTNREVFRQDMNTVEGTHQMMRSGVLSQINVCDEEILIRHAYAAMDRFLKKHP